MNIPYTPSAELDEWDKLLDGAFDMGPLARSTRAGEWWVLTGMHVRLPEALADRPAGTSKLLVLADTISIGPGPGRARDRPSGVVLENMSDVLLIGNTILNLRGSRGLTIPTLATGATFRMAIVGRTLDAYASLYFTMRSSNSANRGTFVWTEPDIQKPVQTEFHLPDPSLWRFESRTLPLPDSGAGLDAACRTFLARFLLTAQSLFDANRPDDADRVLSRLETLLALNPSVASWQHLAAQCEATREMLEPQLQGSDLVPALSPAVYGGVARSYGPALKAFAGRFDEFVRRSADGAQRRAAALLLIGQEDNALRFQDLVTRQLEDNLAVAAANLDRAQASMEAQSRRVERAERAFQAGIDAWEAAQRRQAQRAIISAVFSAVVGVATILAGKPPNVKDMADKAEQAGTAVQKIFQALKKLEKIVKAVGKLLAMVRAILPQASRLANAGTLAARMADVRREADTSQLDGAPSESAYWDQFWVEIEIALTPALAQQIGGASDYLQQLKVLIIYGRALTSAQAAISPIAQELAQAHLLTKLAQEQREAIDEQLEALDASTPSSGLAVTLWLRHRSVQRAAFAALQDFDAAHRYWALDTDRPQRDPSRPITGLADDLLEIADVEASARRALESFNPRPQDFRRVKFEVPASAIADFLRDGSFTLHFTPGFSPLAGWGDVGRVRVREVAAWVIWKGNTLPLEHGSTRPLQMEFTIETSGDYQDQRVQSGEITAFHFIGPRVNQSFRYRPVDATTRQPDTIITPGEVAKSFQALYSEPTLFTAWQFSLPRTGSPRVIDPKAIEALAGFVEGIEVEFSGSHIKDPDRF